MSSLAALAMRLSAVRALDGHTLAADRVYDSALVPIDMLVANGQTLPFIVVSTEDEDRQTEARDINGGVGTVELVLEVAIAHAVDADNGDGVQVQIPATDGGLELTLAILQRQILRCLFETQGNAWSGVFRQFAFQVPRITVKRGTGTNEAGRFAARQIILTVSGLLDPPFGAVPAPQTPFGNLITLMMADPDLAALAPVIESVIEGETIPDWDQLRSEIGMGPTEAAATGIAAAGAIAGEAPPLVNDGALDDGN